MAFPAGEGDEDFIGILELAAAKLSPVDLEIYAGSSAVFRKGGFRKGKAAHALIRARISEMLRSSAPIEPELRKLLLGQLKSSLEVGAASVPLKNRLEKALEDLEALKGCDARLEKELSARERLEEENRLLKEENGLLKRESGRLRQENERIGASLRQNEEKASAAVEAKIAHRLAEEAIYFYHRRPECDDGLKEGALPKIEAYIGRMCEREMPSVQTMIDFLHKAGAAAKPEKDYLLKCVQRRKRELAGTIGDPLAEDSGDELRPRDVLESALRGKRELALLVDAHNTLFALQCRYRSREDRGNWPGKKARDALVADMADLVCDSPGVRVYLVFDGPVRSESLERANLAVIYSGGSGEHRADIVLADQARFLSEAGFENMLIVTNDGGLIGQASRYGAKALFPGELLRHFG